MLRDWADKGLICIDDRLFSCWGCCFFLPKPSRNSIPCNECNSVRIKEIKSKIKKANNIAIKKQINNVREKKVEKIKRKVYFARKANPCGSIRRATLSDIK